MASCWSSFGISTAAETRNEVVLIRGGNQCSLLSHVRFSYLFPVLSRYSTTRNELRKQRFVVMSLYRYQAEEESGRMTAVANEGPHGALGKDVDALETEHQPKIDTGGSGGDLFSGSNGNGSSNDGGGGGGGGGGDEDGDDHEEKDFGPIMRFDEVIEESKARGVTLPSDMLEAAKSVGIRKVLLLRYLDLQGSGWPLGFAVRSFSMFRNRMLADPRFLFKVGTEVAIDSCCATVAEVRKRGKDFWGEFELYVADLMVGLSVDVALVGLLAPFARIGRPATSKGLVGRLQRAYRALPSSFFEAERPGVRFSIYQRIATYFSKGILYGIAGFGCGILGQGTANTIMNIKRSIKESENDVPVPPLLKSAALWSAFLAVSSNARYQIVNGLERLVESSTIGKRVPPLALAFTVVVRFANNIYGGMQFVDWARWSGVQ